MHPHSTTAKTAYDAMLDALLSAHRHREAAEDAYDREEADARASCTALGIPYLPSPADHARARLTEVQQPIEEALRTLLGDEDFEQRFGSIRVTRSAVESVTTCPGTAS